MIIDARAVPRGTIVETDLCIIGAGAAGITLAREFRQSPFRVALLESGGMQFDEETQELYEGRSIGDPFSDLTADRLRYFGGSTNHWGGWCLPLDAIDFEPRGDGFPYHGWPLTRAQLDPWYARAQEVCQLGPYEYRPSQWSVRPDKVPQPFAGPDFEVKILQESPPTRFGPVYAPQLRRAPRVTVYLHANAFYLDAGETASEVTTLAVKTLSGNQFTVRARFYVLAAGGIENARLLLASGPKDGTGIGNAYDLVGRFFMTHLADSGGTIVPADPYTNFAFATNNPWIPGKYRVDRILGLSPQSMRRRHLPNMIFGWDYQFAPVREAVDALKRVTHGEGPGGSALSDLSEVIANFEGVTDFLARKVLFGDGIPIEKLNLWWSCEQRPNRESRVSLGPQRDRLGMPEVVVDWRVLAEDRRNAVDTLRLLGTEIGSTGFGRFHSVWPDADKWPAGLAGNEHHMGTTRMHRDPKLGVVDADCRMHAVANLFIAGSSVFPTGGAANPTLTIVALALRLADHVKQLFG
ncbi:MAG TPA: GMC family oxidoreductase [Stellaceae bacterium]|nr:GMC family oxidoreductase [Stellaceae bacterium]